MNTFHLGYKDQSVYAVSGTSRCLFSDKYKTHKNSVGRTYNCWMLNCWCITWPVGFKSLRYMSSGMLRCIDCLTTVSEYINASIFSVKNSLMSVTMYQVTHIQYDINLSHQPNMLKLFARYEVGKLSNCFLGGKFTPSIQVSIYPCFNVSYYIHLQGYTAQAN